MAGPKVAGDHGCEGLMSERQIFTYLHALALTRPNSGETISRQF
jgi:hypothetical protein